MIRMHARTPVTFLTVTLFASALLVAGRPLPAQAATIALRGTPAVTSNAAPGASQAFSTPAAAVAGDELVAALNYKTPGLSDITNTAPAGWTKVAGETFDCGTTTTCTHEVIATHPAGGGAENFTWTFASAPAGLVLAVTAYSGVDTASPWDKTGYKIEAGGSATTTHTAPSFVPSVAGTWGVAAFGTRASETWTPGAGLTERVDQQAAPSAQASLEFDDSNGVLTSGTTYSYSATEPVGTSVAVGFAGNLKPAAAPPPQQPPTVTTGTASGITDTSATLNGTVNPNGAATTYHFEYGLTASYGTNVPVPDGSAGSGTTAVGESASITGLTASTVYHFRLVASSAGGTGLGADATFTTGATPPPCQPSGVCMPVGDLPGWHQIKTEDFTVGAPAGSFANACSPQQVVYTGATGTQWREYPQCYNDTNGRPYRPDSVLSVHDGVLDFDLNKGGVIGGANPSPILDNATGNQYQTYGRYTMRFALDTANQPDYKTAILLWPHVDADWQCAESDYPEASLVSTTVSAFHHYGCAGSQTQFVSPVFDRTTWHTFTQEWSPGSRCYYFDDVSIGCDITHPVYAGEQRWQLQVETRSAVTGANEGHLLVDWAAVYSYVAGP